MSQSSIVGARTGASASVGPPGTDPPLKDVLVELWQNLEKLVRQEIALAGAELELKSQKLKAELFAMAIGAALMLAGALALVATLILALSLVMPAWTAALITGAAATGAGFGLIKSKKPSAADLTPERTIRSLEKDIHTFTEPTK